jgi:hypothetical protein
MNQILALLLLKEIIRLEDPNRSRRLERIGRPRIIRHDE